MFTHNRRSLDLNGTWKFNPDPYQRCRQQKWWLKEGGNDSFFPCFNLEGLWDTQVPGTWKKSHPGLEWYDGHANYVREFELDEVPADMEAFLCFDGVTYRGEIYLNGHDVGTHEWGYSPFQMRVTGMLQKTNRLFVLVDNFMREDRVPGIRCDWNNDGGITGGVSLILVPKIHIENFRTWTHLDGASARIGIEASARSFDSTEGKLDAVFEIPELGISQPLAIPLGGKASAEITVSLEKLELWCPENPKLYETRLVTAHETLADEIGYREIKTSGTEILLNGKPIRLHGVAVHSEFPATGRAATEEGIALMLEKARELGCNFLRCAHYPYADIFARAMDRAGMLWWEEVPVYWLVNVHKEPQLSLALGMLREMIVRDWNRASLIFWSVSNECAGDGSPAGAHRSLDGGNYPYWVKACALVRELDPTRLLSSADSGHRRTTKNNWTPQAGDAFDTKIKGEDWHPGHPDAFYDLLDVLGANLYVPTPGDNPLATDKFVDMLRRFNKPLMITEFGSMSTAGALPPNSVPTDLGHPDRHAGILREAYRGMGAHPEIVGYVPWALMDVRVPMHWRWYNRGSGTFAYGLLDNQYRKKAVFEFVREEIRAMKARYGELPTAASPDSKLRVGLHGVAGHQVDALLRDHSDATLVAVSAFSVERIPAGVKAHSTLADMLAAGGLDLVVLCPPVRAKQIDDIIACLEAGCHAYAEKPAVVHPADLDRLLEVVRRTGRQFHEMGGSFGGAHLTVLRERIARGDIGKVVQIFHQKSYPWADWRPDDENADGGLAMQVGIYPVRFALHVAGQKLRDLRLRETLLGNDRKGSDCRRAVELSMEFESGAIGTAICNYLNPIGGSRWSMETVRIFGTDGILEFSDPANEILWHHNGRTDRIAVPAESSNEFDLLVGRLRRGEASRFPLEEELEPTRWLAKAKTENR